MIGFVQGELEVTYNRFDAVDNCREVESGSSGRCGMAGGFMKGGDGCCHGNGNGKGDGEVAVFSQRTLGEVVDGDVEDEDVWTERFSSFDSGGIHCRRSISFFKVTTRYWN